MNRFYKWLTIILALCLPWHGAISVFLPDFARYWKEFVLFLFFATALRGAAGFLGEIYFKSGLEELKKLLSPDLKNKSHIFAGLFLVYGSILVLFAPDKITALIAFRYLGLGIAVYLLFYLVSKNPPLRQGFGGQAAKFQKFFAKYFSLTFIYSSLASVLFGSWIKFGNGAEITRNFYSQTISSWVPGQKIPLWHEAGDFIRMQGASSGPIEFSHLLVVVLFLTLISKLKNIYKILFSAIFLFGIWQSASRAAMLGAVIILVFNVIYPLIKKGARGIFSAKILGGIGFLLFLIIALTPTLSPRERELFLERAGTSAHFTRPVEAAKFGLENIFSNNLGKLGPAARAKNLREKNDDKAMIAEHVFVDVFAQMGIIGLFLYLAFFYFLFWDLQPKFRGIFWAILILMNLATIFDMTPVAITFFTIFFLGTKLVNPAKK